MAYNTQSWTNWGKPRWTGKTTDANNDEYEQYIDDKTRGDYSPNDRINLNKDRATQSEAEYQRLAPGMGNALGNQQFNQLRDIHNKLPQLSSTGQGMDESVPPDMRGKFFAPGTGNPGPIQDAYGLDAPTAGIKPLLNYTVPPGTGGIKAPIIPTQQQMTPDGTTSSGVKPPIQNPTLSGSLGAAPSSMSGLSTPKATPGMPNPRPTRNFGSRLRANRGMSGFSGTSGFGGNKIV